MTEMNSALKCEICSSTNGKIFAEIPDYNCKPDSKWYKKLFKLYRCHSCGHVFVLDKLNYSELKEVYSSGNYFAAPIYADPTKEKRLTDAAQIFVDDIERRCGLQAPLKFFEIGASFGHLLKYVNRKGHTGAGIEPSKQASAQCISEGLNVTCNSIEEFQPSDSLKCDVVVSISSFEHVHGLDLAMSKVKGMLHSKGCFYIEVPTIDSLRVKLGGAGYIKKQVSKATSIFHPIEHIRYFSSESMRKFLSLHFKHVEELPDPRYGTFYKKSFIKNVLSKMLGAAPTGNIVFIAREPIK